MNICKTKNVYLDCLKGNALCCKDNIIDLTVDEIALLYDKAPLVITFGLAKKGREATHFICKFMGKKLFLYLSVAMLVQNGCVFLENNKCSIYEKRPRMCRAFPLKKEHTLQRDLEICRQCGEACLNEVSGFPIIVNQKIVESSLKSSLLFHQEHFRSIVILKKLIFNDWVDFMIHDTEGKRSFDLLVHNAYTSQQHGNCLWIQITPEFAPFFKDVLSQLHINPETFFSQQLQVHTHFQTIKNPRTTD
jgi:Fe-S-cluster containining protein